MTFLHAHLVQIEIHEMTNHFVITVVQASIDGITIEALGVLGLELGGEGEGVHVKVHVCRWRYAQVTGGNSKPRSNAERIL